MKGDADWSDVINFTTNSVLLLANDAANNSEAISTAATSGKKYDVTLTSRTLYKDGEWNTLCLPFDCTVAGSILDGAIVKTMTDASMSGSNVSITFNSGSVEIMEAGTPYLIKWASGDNIVNPVFENVTISNTTGQTIESTDGSTQFVGYYDAFNTNGDPSIYYMTTGNELKYSTKNRNLKSCRAYFRFNTNTSNPQALAFKLDFGDGVITDIDALDVERVTLSDGDVIYDLSGRRVSKPTHGLYIVNGKKVFIR